MSNNPSTQKIWQDLYQHHKSWSDMRVADLFEEDKARFDTFSLFCDGFLFDYSKNLITSETLDLLCQLADDSGLKDKQNQMLSGAQLNHTEGRAVLHTALRGSVDANLSVDGENVSAFVETLQNQIKDIASSIRANDNITDVIHIGVGGSDLGPNLVLQALAHNQSGPRVHFINNIDGQTIASLLLKLKAENTVILIASKTFTTLETCTNAYYAKDWMLKSLSEDAFAKQCYAMTSCVDKAIDFGIGADNILPMRDWIGGRFSLWSSIGLPIAIAVGPEIFTQLLNGAKTADRHFLNQPWDQNIPVLMALLGVWYRNAFDYSGHAVLPYSDSLSLFPTYMQQLDMESNGKHSDDFKTAPLVIGGAGTCAQHAFMQSLHQSKGITPCDFIVIANNPNAPHTFQTALNANALAQSQALMHGRDVNADQQHRHFPGNRPSSTFILPTLNAYYLGMLLAFYEHKIFTQGVIWGINSFDQWGVELGKTLAKDIIADLKAQSASSSHDSSTQGLIHAILESKNNQS